MWPHTQLTRFLRPQDSPGKNTGVGCHFLLQCMKVKSEREVAQSCPTLSDPMDCSPSGSSVHGIFQARVLEWGAIAFSISQYRNSKRKYYKKQKVTSIWVPNWGINLTKEVKNLYAENHKTIKIKLKMTQRNGKITHAFTLMTEIFKNGHTAQNNLQI